MAAAEPRRLDDGRPAVGDRDKPPSPAGRPLGDWKHCHGCDQLKLRTEFQRDRGRSDGLQARCRDCKNAYKRAHPLSSDQRDHENALRREHYKSDPEYRARVLAYNLKQRRSAGAREKQIGRNQEAYARRVVLRRQFQEIKREMGCFFCAEREPVCLDLHHAIPGEKEFSVSQHFGTRKMVKLVSEAAKCVVLCATCHRKVHYGFLSLPDDAPRVVLSLGSSG